MPARKTDNHHSLVTLPRALRERVELELFSPSEGRVPYGAFRDFMTARVSEFFSWKTLSLEPFGYPPGYFIRGPQEMLQAVRLDLEALHVLRTTEPKETV